MRKSVVSMPRTFPNGCPSRHCAASKSTRLTSPAFFMHCCNNNISSTYIYNMADGCEQAQRVAISLTHVEYTKGDLMGYCLAWASLAPIFLLVSFATLIVFRRDLHTMIFFLGILMNEGCNFVLKHIIREPRPDNKLFSSNLFVEYGMPSSHAQYMAFFATYFTLFVFIRVTLSEGLNDYLCKGLCSFAALTGSFLCTFSRLYLGYHSLPQILYGSLLGFTLGCAWFMCVHYLLSPYFPKIYHWWVAELLLVKDMSLIPNYFWYEFTAVRYETRTRMKRKSM